MFRECSEATVVGSAWPTAPVEGRENRAHSRSLCHAQLWKHTMLQPRAHPMGNHVMEQLGKTQPNHHELRSECWNKIDNLESTRKMVKSHFSASSAIRNYQENTNQISGGALLLAKIPKLCSSKFENIRAKYKWLNTPYFSPRAT